MSVTAHIFFGKKGKVIYMTTQVVNVIGAGLAGSEAAYQIAKRGVQVKLYEMRPVRQTPAHHTDKFAELVCSNSLRANTLTNAVGVIKEEMRLMDSVIIRAADECSVPAGGALAVDRHEFAAKVTEYVKNHPNVTVMNEEITEIQRDQLLSRQVHLRLGSFCTIKKTNR